MEKTDWGSLHGLLAAQLVNFNNDGFYAWEWLMPFPQVQSYEHQRSRNRLKK